MYVYVRETATNAYTYIDNIYLYAYTMSYSILYKI